MSTENEEKIIGLLEKQIIIQLINSGVKRDDIMKILGVGPQKISDISKYMKKGENKNG